MDFYQNLAYFAIFVLNLLVGKYYEKIFKTEKDLSLIFIPILFYIIILFILFILSHNFLYLNRNIQLIILKYFQNERAIRKHP